MNVTGDVTELPDGSFTTIDPFAKFVLFVGTVATNVAALEPAEIATCDEFELTAVKLVTPVSLATKVTE